MSQLNNYRIVLGISGGIAAYKSADLVRRLREQGADVEVVMTQAATEFITPLTLQAVSGRPVRQSLFDAAAEAAMGHIELARWADLILIAPASADLIARLSYGHANDLLTTLCLATTAAVAVVPAMNQQMWQHSATQENLQRLLQRKVLTWGPADGAQACGEFGPGRMLEPIDIVDKILKFRYPKTQALAGKRVLITAGPTRESIDPVRFLTNHSSGKMGFALAQAASAVAADVTLIAGPVNLATPPNVQRVDVVSAADMYAAVLKQIDMVDIFISAAAVADYSLATIAEHKLKKSTDNLQLELIRTIDILAEIVHCQSKPFCVGFAAETENILENARQKLANKKLDMIVANDVSHTDIGFQADDNAVTLIWQGGEQCYDKQSKQLLAQQLINKIGEHYYAKNPS